jgi:hypothetical protein
LADGTETTVVVNKKELTVTAVNKTVTYGDAVPALTYTMTGFAAGGDNEANSVTGTPALSTLYTSATSVTASPVTITAANGTLASANYSFAFVNGAITINKASSSITVTGSTSFEYNGSAQGPATNTKSGSTGAVTYSYSGVNPTVYGASSTAPTNVGTYQVVATLASDDNFNGATSAVYEFAITKKALTVTAENKSKVADGSVFSAFTYEMTGFANSENEADLRTDSKLSGTVTYTGNATTATTPGVYNTITPVVSALSATNYTFTPANGTLTIYPTTPTGPATKSFCTGATIADLKAAVTGTTGILTVYDATNGNVLDNGTVLTTAKSYYVSQIINAVESDRLTVAVTVYVTPTGGSIIPASFTVCYGTNSTVLTVSGYSNGTVARWESSNNSDFSSHIDIENTNNTYTATNLTATMTYYRAIIANAGCEVSSASAFIYVAQLPTITTTGTAATVTTSASVQNTTLAYTATANTPVSYSIDWTGIADQGTTTITFQSGAGSVTGIVIPANTAAGVYSGTMTITTAAGCTATQAVSVTVAPSAPTGAPTQTFCGNN